MGLISFIKRMNSKESDEGQTASAVDSEKENGHAIGKIESKTERKNRMNTDIKAVNSLIEELKDNLGDALISTEISSFQIGSSIVGYQVNEKRGAMINQYTKYIVEVTQKVNFGGVTDYYVVDIAKNVNLFVLIFEDYCWPILVDTTKVTLGMMISAVLPDCINGFKRVFK